MRTKLPKHIQQSRAVLERLAKLGLSLEVQQRLGAFGIVWGMFETNLEKTLWALHDEEVVGVQPSTDKSMINDWIKVFGKGSEKFGADVQALLNSAAEAATNLMEYRHSIVHGTLVPSPSISEFVRNPTWGGVIRKRKTSDAHVNENLLDMAIDATWILGRVVVATRAACNDASKVQDLLALKSDLGRARSSASELRHLAAYMNHEKN